MKPKIRLHIWSNFRSLSSSVKNSGRPKVEWKPSDAHKHSATVKARSARSLAKSTVNFKGRALDLGTRTKTLVEPRAATDQALREVEKNDSDLIAASFASKKSATEIHRITRRMQLSEKPVSIISSKLLTNSSPIESQNNVQTVTAPESRSSNALTLMAPIVLLLLGGAGYVYSTASTGLGDASALIPDSLRPSISTKQSDQKAL